MRRRFRVSIKVGNQAMFTHADVAEALQKVAADLQTCPCFDRVAPVFDRNGNEVGNWWWETEEDDS